MKKGTTKPETAAGKRKKQTNAQAIDVPVKTGRNRKRIREEEISSDEEKVKPQKKPKKSELKVIIGFGGCKIGGKVCADPSRSISESKTSRVPKDACQIVNKDSLSLDSLLDCVENAAYSLPVPQYTNDSSSYGLYVVTRVPISDPLRKNYQFLVCDDLSSFLENYDRAKQFVSELSIVAIPNATLDLVGSSTEGSSQQKQRRDDIIALTKAKIEHRLDLWITAQYSESSESSFEELAGKCFPGKSATDQKSEMKKTLAAASFTVESQLSPTQTLTAFSFKERLVVELKSLMADRHCSAKEMVCNDPITSYLTPSIREPPVSSTRTRDFPMPPPSLPAYPPNPNPYYPPPPYQYPPYQHPPYQYPPYQYPPDPWSHPCPSQPPCHPSDYTYPPFRSYDDGKWRNGGRPFTSMEGLSGPSYRHIEPSMPSRHVESRHEFKHRDKVGDLPSEHLSPDDIRSYMNDMIGSSPESTVEESHKEN